MKTIIVPTDFSATAYNAARYALGLAAQIGEARVLLYHAYEIVVPIPDLPTSTPILDPDEMKHASLEGLDKMKQELRNEVPAGVIIETKAENQLLAAHIDGLCKDECADLVVMGTMGGSHLEEVLVGSNTVDVVKHTSCPVIVVPVTSTYRPIHKVVFACDFKKVGPHTPIEPLKKLLDIFKAELHVLNIDKENKGVSADAPMASLLMDTFLEGYNPVYHFVDNDNVVQGIMDFGEKANADLIMIIPRKHGLFENIFRRSRTTQLTFHTKIPLLAIHE
jgi:nucleotide-binding universal stress UspA family protein